MEKPDNLEMTETLFAFLQGTLPDGVQVREAHVPCLTADQAWTVIWFLGNQYWQVTDHIGRCDVCGSLFDTHSEGECLDFGDLPYFFCESCHFTEEYETKMSHRPADDA